MSYQKITRNKTRVCSALILFCFLFSFPVQAMRDRERDQSLYEVMDYVQMCDQEHILKKAKNVLKHEGITFDPNKKNKQKKTGAFDWMGDVFHVLFCGCYRKYKKYDALRKLKKYDNQLSLLPDNSSNARDNETLHRDNDDGTLQLLVPRGNPNPDTICEIRNGRPFSYQELRNSDTNENKDELDKKNDKLSKEASKVLNKALVEDFWDKKQEAMKKTLGSPLFSSAAYGGVMGAIALLVKDKVVVINSIGWIIAFSVNQFSRAFYSINISPLSDDLKEHEARYAKLKRRLPESLQERIEKNFSMARKNPQDMKKTDEFAKVALNIPLKSKRLKSTVDCTAEIDELLGYDTKKAKRIVNAFYCHSGNYSEKAAPFPESKIILYLQGPPGIGKTYIAGEISKCIGTKLIEVKTEGGVIQIVGSENNKGSLIDAITQKGVKRNDPILIDELDKILNDKNVSLSFFLKFLDPDRKHWYSPYLQAEIDISHFMIIGTGNEPIGQHVAFKDRMITVVLKELDKKTKKKVAGNILQRKFEGNPDKYLAKDIEWLVENDKNPGVRELRRSIYRKIGEWKEREERKRKLPQVRKAELKQAQAVFEKCVLANDTLRKAYLERKKRKAPVEDKKNK
ncbi:AAA family ATPase [Candidatus Dependentiae bacterium]